jgi:protein-S-isoprenylcysteine O-methyltransferase Ste14
MYPYPPGETIVGQKGVPAMNVVYKIILFVFASLGIVWVSRSSLRSYRNHGFYRFFSWEVILVLFLMNMDYWFIDPFNARQIFAWLFLLISLILILQGVRLFQQRGNIDQNRSDPALMGVEKTTELVTSGVYHYIRHPFYSSLLFLGWGILLKHVTWMGIFLAVANTVFLLLTAKIEESEDVQYFGEPYQKYKTQTKMFIPFIF